MRPVQPRIVPMGPHISSIHDPRHVVSNSARRLEVTFVAVYSPAIVTYLVIIWDILFLKNHGINRSAEICGVASPVGLYDKALSDSHFSPVALHYLLE